MGDRLAFDARYISDRYHGVGRCAFRLLEALVEAAPDRQFLVYRSPTPDSRFDWARLAALPNVELRRGPSPLYSPHEHAHWAWLLRRDRAALFHSPFFVAPLAPGCPAIVTVHDLIFDRYPQYMPRRWAYPYYRLTMRLSLRRAQRVISVSQATASDLQRFYQLDQAKVRVVPNAVDPHFAAAAQRVEPAELRRRYGLEGPFVLAVGARRPHKNFARLVRGFALLAHEVPHQLVLVGSVDQRFPDEAAHAAQATGVADRLRSLEWVPEADLAGLYALADAVVVPSLVEGFGLPALEAMSCATPVLASAASSLPEVVGDAGLLVDPYDEQAICAKLRRLLCDTGLRERLALAGPARAAGYSWREAAERTLRVYEEVLR